MPTTSYILSGVVSRSIFELITAVIGALGTVLTALLFLRKVRIERPAIGTFNGRDVVILIGFLSILPAIYLVLPQWAVIGLLCLTFASALSIGFSPVIGANWTWLGIALLLGANVYIGLHMLGYVIGWQVFWAETSVLVWLAAVSVSNLYVQGGMRLRHVAWLAIGLAVYDVIFTIVWPVSNYLLREFVGHPLFPAIGMRVQFDEAVIGLGDLLVYSLFTVAAAKAYGRKAVKIALVLVTIFGAVLPSLSSLLINFIDSRGDIVIPAQTWFGPAAFIGYVWMRRHYGRERTMQEFLADTDAERAESAEPAVAAGELAEPAVVDQRPEPAQLGAD